MSSDSVRAAYRVRAHEYVAALGTMDQVTDEDLDLVATWAGGLSGQVLDVGCGPGHWTHYLSTRGVQVQGVDPVREFIDSAKSAFPGKQYRLGRAESLDVATGTLGGVLAWYSLIHTAPERIEEPLHEFARCLVPGGGLALGFFSGPNVEAFAHKVTTAYYWPIDVLASKVEKAGFTITHTETRTDPGRRKHGAILATR